MFDLNKASGAPEWADPLAIMSGSARFDLIFKMELADAWVHGDARAIRTAEEAYLEMQRARNGLRETKCDPPRSGPKAFLEAFRQTAASLYARGYDKDAPAIPLDANGELLNGAHRLATCAAYGKPCLVQVMSDFSSGGSRLQTFLDERMAEPVVSWGMRAYLRRLPHGRLAETFAAKCGADAPFPDWTERAKSLRMYSLKWRLFEKAYRLKAFFRKGSALERALKHADVCRHRAIAPWALAEYWKKRESSTPV